MFVPTLLSRRRQNFFRCLFCSIYIYMHICLEGLLLPELWQNRRPLNDQSCLESLEVEGMFPQSPEQQLHPATSFMDDLDECLESRV